MNLFHQLCSIAVKAIAVAKFSIASNLQIAIDIVGVDWNSRLGDCGVNSHSAP